MSAKRDDERIESVERDIQALKQSIAANTQLTAELKKDVQDWRDETLPVIDAMRTMAAGIRTIGRIGAFGTRFAKFVLICVACWGALKLILLGASWSEISAAFWRALAK